TRRQRRWPSSFSAPEPTSSSPSPTPSIPRCSASPCDCSPTRGSEEVSDRRRDTGEGLGRVLPTARILGPGPRGAGRERQDERGTGEDPSGNRPLHRGSHVPSSASVPGSGTL